MRQLYENSSTATYVRETTVAMRTASGTVVVMPAGESKDTWKPESDTDKDAYPTVIVSEDQATVESNFVFSGVAAFASADFISSDWSQYTSVANLNATLDITNYLTGSTDNPFNFVAKKLTNEDFRVNVTESKTLAIRIIFMAVVPIIIVAVGITVWIRRKDQMSEFETHNTPENEDAKPLAGEVKEKYRDKRRGHGGKRRAAAVHDFRKARVQHQKAGAKRWQTACACLCSVGSAVHCNSCIGRFGGQSHTQPERRSEQHAVVGRQSVLFHTFGG